MGTSFIPAEAFPPGDYLRDEMAERGWSEKELAEMVRCPALVAGEIMGGRMQIDTEIARALGTALGTSAELWLNLQAAYNLAKTAL